MRQKVSSWYRQIKEALIYEVDAMEWLDTQFSHQN